MRHSKEYGCCKVIDIYFFYLVGEPRDTAAAIDRSI